MIKLGDIKLGMKKYSPELLLVGGLVTGTACVVTASRASIKASAITKDMKHTIAYAAADLEEDLVTEDEFKTVVKKEYTKYALQICKEFALPAALYAGTIVCIFGSYKIQKNRNVALSTALTATTAAYTALVSKLRNGAKFGLSAEEVLKGVEGKEVVDPETGEVTIEKTQGKAVEGIYDYKFDNYALGWSKDHFQNECTLQAEENWANDKLKLDGYIFLNDILERLGLPRTRAGQFLGWKLNGNGDGFVDFGIVDCNKLEGCEWNDNAFNLSFNVDGDILTNFPE